MAIAVYGVATSELTIALYTLFLGTRLGLVMQVLVTVVHNAIQHEDLGAATASANFFRSIGGSFDAAVFGAFYVNELPHCQASGLGAIPLVHTIPPRHLWAPKHLRRTNSR